MRQPALVSSINLWVRRARLNQSVHVSIADVDISRARLLTWNSCADIICC